MLVGKFKADDYIVKLTSWGDLVCFGAVSGNIGVLDPLQNRPVQRVDL